MGPSPHEDAKGRGGGRVDIPNVKAKNRKCDDLAGELATKSELAEEFGNEKV